MQARTLGLAFALALCVLFAFGQAVSNPTPLVRVQYLPHPRDMVKIVEGTPYVVPVEKIFVLTGMGSTETIGIYDVTLRLNGQQVYQLQSTDCTDCHQSVYAVTPGTTFPAGSLLEVRHGSSNYTTDAVALGYLATQ